MEIGNNEFDDIDDFDLIEGQPTGLEPQINQQQEDNFESNDDEDEDFVIALLKSKGIEDMSKIKFEDEDGSVEEKDWNSLSNKEKFNIISQTDSNSNDDLDNDEIQLINAIRASNLTPSEYLQKIQSDGINYYVQNSQAETYPYQVDQLNDDELFVYDFISRMGDVTDEEVREALDNAKSNESLFAKQINSIRKEYKDAENESIRQAQLEQQEQAKEQYYQFANQVVDSINDLSDFSGYDLNMDDDDKQLLYDFITGVDGAGNNHFAKALSDPKVLVRTAWLALNGEEMINNITEYFQKEISNVRKESYEKGKADAKKKDTVVYKQKSLNRIDDVYDDLDTF